MEQIRTLDELLERMSAEPSRRVVVAAGHDPHTLQACAMASQRKIADITLVGREARIGELCVEYGIDESLFTIVNEENAITAGKIALDMVNEGQADVLMKGLLTTDQYMRLILDKEKGLLPPGALLSHVTVFEVPAFEKVHNKLLFVTDVAVLPAPSLADKVKMVGYAVRTAQSFGVECPKVAMLAATEQVSIKMPACTDAAVISKMAERGQLGNCLVDGPLAFDVAVSPECCRIKGLKSSVEGSADILVFHCLEASNTFYKTLTLFSGAKLAGGVMGTKAPCVLTSRADSEDSKLYAIALACRLVK